jgi:hypothetical protein
MKLATGLALLAAGAILAFAVSASPPDLNLNVAGWVIMLTGLAGIVVPARAPGWLRRRIVARRRPAGPVADTVDDAAYAAYAPYVLRDPAALASAILRDAELAGISDDDGQTASGLTSGDPAGGQAGLSPD